MTDAEKLRLLADWFDERERDKPEASDEVQQDLRRIAGELETADRRVCFQATSVEADAEQGIWYVHILDEPVHHTTEGVPVHLDWTRDGTLIGVELLSAGEPKGER